MSDGEVTPHKGPMQSDLFKKVAEGLNPNSMMH